MTENVTALPIGQLWLSRISYFCDLGRSSGFVLPLGAIAEITLGPIRALGLIARTGLEEHEIANVGEIIRSTLHNPFEFLSREFDWAWNNTASGQALQSLAVRHSDALFFSPPKVDTAMMGITQLAMADAAEFARAAMCSRRDKEFYSLLLDTWSITPVIERQETTKLAA